MNRGIILCNDILYLIGKEVNHIRNKQWWIHLYNHLPNDRMYSKDINAIHASKIATEFIYFQNLKHNSILPFLLWDDILQHTLFKFHAMMRNESYECLPSQKYIQSNQKLIQKIHKHLDF